MLPASCFLHIIGLESKIGLLACRYDPDINELHIGEASVAAQRIYCEELQTLNAKELQAIDARMPMMMSSVAIFRTHIP